MVTDINNQDFSRTITHTSYKHGNKKVKKGGFSRMLQMQITENKHQLRSTSVGIKSSFYPANENFLKYLLSFNEVAYWGGGISLLLFISFIIVELTSNEKSFDLESFFFLIPSFAILCFFLAYYFTMPDKECIFNRRDSTVTFPGFMWNKNITMPINEVIFSMTSPSAQGLGAYMLEIVRPDKTYSLFLCTLGNSCYEDLSFLLWYMDKNRPLPPGDGFNAYRQKDFERRKTAGFPKPMFPAAFETPEATPEQQAERIKIAGWYTLYI